MFAIPSTTERPTMLQWTSVGEWWVVPQLLSLSARLHFFPSVEMWHRLLEAPLRNWVNGFSHEGHFDSERVAGCSAASC